jgi:hypothetical protein
MVLSNSAKSFLICTLILFAMLGCNWRQENNTNNGVIPGPKNDIPFPTAEPDVFQCNILRSDGEHEQKTFFARKNGNWRFDLGDGTVSGDTILRTDKYYRVNNDKKVFAETPRGDPSAAEPEFLSDLTFSALKQDGETRFEKLGPDGGLVKYSAKIGDSDNAKAVIYVDETNGLIMKEEFFSLKGQNDNEPTPSFVFELRDLKMDVDDSIFAIPPGYKKLSWNDYLTATRSKK